MLPGKPGRLPDPKFWRDRSVLLTGHTGFKGTWMCALLQRLGADVIGISLKPPTEPSMFEVIGANLTVRSHELDIRDKEALIQIIREFAPTTIIHMAAQSLIFEGMVDAAGTFDTNVAGTINVLEAARVTESVGQVLVITSDKVYANVGSEIAFAEDAALGGDEPYSASKACAEIATNAYAKSFLEPKGVRVATARAGNVIGGGDWAQYRLIPDLWRAATEGRPVMLRCPDAIRPWQHVLDPLLGYLLYVEALSVNGGEIPRALNFGPTDTPRFRVRELTEMFFRAYGTVANQSWERDLGANGTSVEKATLDVSAKRAVDSLGWRPRLSIPDAIQWTAEWYRSYPRTLEAWNITNDQISRFLAPD